MNRRYVMTRSFIEDMSKIFSFLKEAVESNVSAVRKNGPGETKAELFLPSVLFRHEPVHA